MLTLNLNEQEKQNLLAAIESAVKHAPNSLQAASILLPLAAKISELKESDGNAEQQ